MGNIVRAATPSLTAVLASTVLSVRKRGSGGKITTLAKMLGRKHEPHCDCNIEHIVSGAGGKCNHRYGVKRQRTKEKRQWKRDYARE